MAEFVHLVGADDVARAGTQIRQAAADIQNAVGDLEQILFVQRQWRQRNDPPLPLADL